MNCCVLYKPFVLAMLFIKEQLKEPIALLWIVISPVASFYLITYARAPLAQPSGDYSSATSWFYAFVAASVAFFGLAFYIVGRRESGFLRSFVYTRDTKAIFLGGQFLAYSFISVLYCAVFYVLTKVYFGSIELSEFFTVVGRFYICFLLFSVFSLLLTLVPMGFQNTSTLFSAVSFAMLMFGVVSTLSSHPLIEWLKVFNPMWWANQVMLQGVANSSLLVAMIVVLFLTSFWMTYRFLLVNPVWSRY